MTEIRAYRVYAIEKGTVIDHISAGKALKVIQILKLDEFNQIVTVGINLESKKAVRKDIVKIENKTLSKQELNKIALISPKATINIAENRLKRPAARSKVSVPQYLNDTTKAITRIVINNPFISAPVKGKYFLALCAKSI